MRTFDEILNLIENEELRNKVLKVHSEDLELMKQVPASVSKHHSYPGGYYDHVLEVCNNALGIVENIELSDSKCSLDDVIIAAYFHDYDKLRMRYQLDEDPPTPAQVKLADSLNIRVEQWDSKFAVSHKIDCSKRGLEVDEDRMPRHIYRTDVVNFVDTVMVTRECALRGIILNDMQLHGITYHQGGWSNGIDERTVLQPIAGILHAADMISTFSQNGMAFSDYGR